MPWALRITTVEYGTMPMADYVPKHALSRTAQTVDFADLVILAQIPLLQLLTSGEIRNDDLINNSWILYGEKRTFL